MKILSTLFKKDKKLNIEFCEKNLDRFLKEEQVEEYGAFLSKKNVLHKEYSCQSHCEKCRLSPYAIVNGEYIAADSYAELLEMLKQTSEQN
ncbi:hypothetical protein WQ57_12340 [Mesobacillus campisalis]|uniref:DUF1450 domain-containing protein n=1 Tax=Mesobacillus campisalis TaxID=1408103 RepID=A0A0M2SVL0_9BACI|nr:DUF1450 domain-containing protein [Mesobacillus campisalis]KKK37741.1 hypothetical protein WQ57_12340 [Mesobacillus campisalis]